MAQPLRKYNSNNDYVNDTSRPGNKSTVSQISHAVKYDGVNIVVEPTIYNVEVGDMIIYDKQLLTHKLLKMATYQAASFDTDRYIVSNFLWHESVGDIGIFVHSTMTASLPWAAKNEFTINSLNASLAGSFDILCTGSNAAATATTIRWDNNSTLADIAAQLTTTNGGVLGNYSTCAVDGDVIVIMVGGWGSNNITITNAEGGASKYALVDCSMYCKVNGVELSGQANEIHRSFQGTSVATCFPSLAADLLPVTSASYTMFNVNRPYRCGLAYQIFKSYVTSYGASSFVDDYTSGSTFPMQQAVFEACNNSGVAAQQACYDRNNGSWETYLHNAMADINSLRGAVGNAYGNLGKQGKLIATCYYFDHNKVWQPCYPPANAATLVGVSVQGYTTGFEPGNGYLSDCYEMTSFMNDDKRLVLNGYISTLGGSTLGSSNLWASEEYYGNYGFLFYAYGGALGDGYKVYSYRGRISLAFRLKS